jgi:membrane-bound lytic murein transglycosylase A
MGVSVRAGLALLVVLGLSACASKPERPVAGHRPPPVHTAPKPKPPAPSPAGPPAPKNAVELGVKAGPPVSSLNLLPEGAFAARSAFLTSCRVLVRRNDASKLTRPADWQPACTAAASTDADPVQFFQQQFETAIVGTGATYDTGYYEPEIDGARTQDSAYATPVYRRPPDLAEVDLGIAAGGPANGKKRRGRMQDGQLVPYYERAEIDGGALSGQNLEIAWARDPIELFFLEIQGSGRLRLPDGTVMRIGYDGQNGRDYVGIGKWMRDQGMIGGTTGYATSMQGIMQWLREHPDQAAGVMQQNKSYVFFRELVGAGPLGALGVPVVGHVSIAADPSFTPLGAPVWISADRKEVTGLGRRRRRAHHRRRHGRARPVAGAGPAGNHRAADGREADRYRGRTFACASRCTLAGSRDAGADDRGDAGRHCTAVTPTALCTGRSVAGCPRISAKLTPLEGRKPLPEAPRAEMREIVPPSPAAIVAEEARARRAAVAKAKPPPPSDTLDGGWDRRLRRGAVLPDRTIDLHGHTLTSAHAALDQALAHAVADDVRVLLVITGKPPRGEDKKRGLIRASIGDWIAFSGYSNRIAAVRNAHPRHGGAGALYLIFRRKRDG